LLRAINTNQLMMKRSTPFAIAAAGGCLPRIHPLDKPSAGSFAAMTLAMMLVMVCNHCPAASLNWAAPQKITGDSDVSLNGVLVRALNATPTNTTLAIDVTLNGVMFVAARKNGSGLYVAPGGDTFQPTDTSSVGPTAGGFQAFGQGGAPFNTLSAACSNLLCTAYWNDGTDIGNTWAATAGYDWTLNNLTVGKTYELQVWVNDSRLSNLGQNNPGLFTSVMDTNGNSVNLEHNVDNILGGVGQYVIGTFTADAASQALKLIGGNTAGADTSGSTATSLLNAYQLRDISPAGAPRFTNTLQSGVEIVLRGDNGPANGAYEMLRSANLTVPAEEWPSVGGVRSFDAGGSFSFTNALPADAVGFYRLHVVSSAPVYPPVLTSQPQDVAIAAGQNATFSVTASGTAPLTYFWHFNTNTLLAGGLDATITITNAQVADSGKISVTVSNLVGVTNSGYATLQVTNVPVYPPVLTSQPQDVAIAVGQNATFNVTASGTAPLTYFWYFNTNTLLASGSNASLTVTNAQLSDAGKYSVTVTNMAGTTNSAFATLTVTNSSQPPVLLTQPTNNNVFVGQTASFSVTASGALPLSYQWYYNTNTPLAWGTNATLSITNAQLTNAGAYSVTVTNFYSSTNSVFATLSVTNVRLAFPEAEGYGKYTVGGRSGAVYEVTNLNATGAGSLGAAISASGARTVVFRVAGTIEGNFSINNDKITIAGQTAPGDGICIKGNLNINAGDVILRYVRVRLDPGIEADAISSRFKKNIILDHVSASWSSDEVMSLYHGTNVTIQWCMLTEGCAKFVNGTNTGHRFGGIWGNNYSTYHHNLIAHNDSRNPRWASGSQFSDYRNNVVYNWGYQSCYGGGAMQDGATNLFDHTTINMVANYYKPGPATGSGVRDRIAEPSEDNGVGSWFVTNNVVEGYPAVNANNWLGVDGSAYIKLDAPWAALPINEETPLVAYTNVLAHAGCSKPNRDSVDTRIMNEVATGTATCGTNGIITYPSDVGGWPTLATGTPPTDTDRDGMPDSWETAHGLNPNNAADRNNYTLSPDYTNLEVYLNELGAF
jgi:hypothetical protein